MGDHVPRAVAVGFSGGALATLSEVLARIGCTLADSAPDGAAGSALIQALQPELVVAAAVMPGMDGTAFVRRIRALRLSLLPRIVLLRQPGLRLPGEKDLPGLGAATADLPPEAGRIRAALTALDAWSRTLPPAKAAQLEELLDALGVPAHPGRDCLALAVALVWHDRRRLRSLKACVYPEAARQTGLSPAQAERALRHVIDAAWRNGEIEQQHRLFGDTIDARRGKPTCGEMIAQLAEELRWEGSGL